MDFNTDNYFECCSHLSWTCQRPQKIQQNGTYMHNTLDFMDFLLCLIPSPTLSCFPLFVVWRFLRMISFFHLHDNHLFHDFRTIAAEQGRRRKKINSQPKWHKIDQITCISKAVIKEKYLHTKSEQKKKSKFGFWCWKVTNKWIAHGGDDMTKNEFS